MKSILGLNLVQSHNSLYEAPAEEIYLCQIIFLGIAQISYPLLNKRSEYIRSRKLAYSTVGTPDYIAPEVFGQ